MALYGLGLDPLFRLCLCGAVPPFHLTCDDVATGISTADRKHRYTSVSLTCPDNLSGISLDFDQNCPLDYFVKMSSIPGIDDMNKLEHKTLVTKPFDLTYSYHLSPGFNKKLDPSVPTLVFTHGFPDDAYMWAGAMPSLLKLPYPFVVVEILGLGDSSKPTDAAKYNYRPQANSIAQILDNEKVPNNVIPIGHDWGSGGFP